MTREERLAQADRLAARMDRLETFAQAATMLLALIPIAYGVLTWIYGAQLWSDSTAYSTALSTPFAPQSWGTIFMVSGLTVVWSGWRDHARCVMLSTGTSAFILAMFMSMFVTEFVQHPDKEGALPPALVYAVLSMLFLARARMAWASLKDG